MDGEARRSPPTPGFAGGTFPPQAGGLTGGSPSGSAGGALSAQAGGGARRGPPTPGFAGGTFPPQAGGLTGGSILGFAGGTFPPHAGGLTGGSISGFAGGSFPPQAGGLTWVAGQRGSITIWGIGLTLVIAAFAGLVIDTWRVFAERQDLSGMADSAAIAGATAIDVAHMNEAGEVILHLADAELRALDYLTRQDGWSTDIVYSIVAAPDGSDITVVLERDVDFTLLGPLLPGEDPLHVTVTSRASPNVVGP